MILQNNNETDLFSNKPFYGNINSAIDILIFKR